LAISRQRKEELVAQYIELLNGSRAVFLTEYTGVTVNQLEELRGEIRKADGAFHITKNTLLRHALQEVGRSLPDELLTGQTAAGFALGELPSLAKALVDFAEEEETFAIKGGLMNGEFLSAAEIEALAKLPSLDELRAQIIGLVNAPARNVATTVSNGVRQLVNVINAYATQEEEAAEPA
jgi:large subunit ribosomal protein L10